MVTPAQKTGPAASSGNPSGIFTTNLEIIHSNINIEPSNDESNLSQHLKLKYFTR